MSTGQPPYIGRFAPSPTGDLHFGSLVAAVGSFLQARSQAGQWLVRVEDIDPPREVAGSTERILMELLRLGMHPDGPILYQSSRLDAYREALEQLLKNDLAFHCGCSRSDLPTGGVYPGTCRAGVAPGRQARSVRARVDDAALEFHDAVQGICRQNLLASCGDFVIYRADKLPAYQLAVVVDDAFQGVTEVVRGADLLDSTARQLHLQRLLGMPQPNYFHLPIALDAEGNKLSKRAGSDPLSAQTPLEAVFQALRFLGQRPPRLGTLPDLWAWSIEHWDPAAVPATGTGARPADSDHGA